MTYNPKIHHRRSIRLKQYDYSRIGCYFVTLCVQDKHHLFGTIEKGEMKLNSFGKIVADEWEKSAQIRDNITMGEYVIMPDHFHGIIRINEQIKNESAALPGEFKSPSNTIGAIIRGFKGAATKRIKSILFASWTGESRFAPAHDPQFALDKSRFSLTENAGESPLALLDNSNFLHYRGESQFAPTVQEINLLKEMNPDKSIWQRNYHESIIRDQRHFENVENYIRNNPKKWGMNKN